jgi:hypothetical protein
MSLNSALDIADRSDRLNQLRDGSLFDFYSLGEIDVEKVNSEIERVRNVLKKLAGEVFFDNSYLTDEIEREEELDDECRSLIG